MLTQIHITNLVTIDQLQIDFQSGTTAITGETGAGKSILIDAIELALGARATGDIVRSGQEKADISLCFDIRKLSSARTWLGSFDLEDENHCVIRRTIHRDGRSRSYINGMPTTLQPLRELSELLIQIHGQHEHQSLLKPDHQRDLLDRYAGHAHLADTVRTFAKELHALNCELKELQQTTEQQTSRAEFLKFQLNELKELHLKENEFAELDIEHKQLAHAGELLEHIHVTLNLLAENEEHNTLSSLNKALQALETVERVDPKINDWIESIKNALLHVSDTENELRRYLDHVEIDPNRLKWTEERIAKLFDMARKHKIAPDELFAFQQKLADELSLLESSDERLSELTVRLTALEKNYSQASDKLSKSREKFAKKLAEEITLHIHELALSNGEFYVELERDPALRFSPSGLEKIIFQIKTNAGLPKQPLAKIASGGELSRISLAIQMATAEQHTVPTLIFDEVDVGIGGSVAETIGKLLRRLGSTHQVLCITHLPQVAAQGHHHLRVAKTSKQNVTRTQIGHLSFADKIQELARMLGGVEMTAKTLAHAKEMLERAC